MDIFVNLLFGAKGHLSCYARLLYSLLFSEVKRGVGEFQIGDNVILSRGGKRRQVMRRHFQCRRRSCYAFSMVVFVVSGVVEITRISPLTCFEPAFNYQDVGVKA